MAQKSLLGLSLFVHGAIGLAIAHVEIQRAREATAIEVTGAKRRDAEKKVEEAPKPPPQAPKRAARRAPRAERQSPARALESASTPLATLPDFGVQLDGAMGGLAIAMPAPGAPSLANTPPRVVAPVVKRPSVVRSPAQVACEEALQKPKPRNIPQPAYTDRARQAGVEGKVRVELTVDEVGHVASARVLEGLGYGLDEEALAAVERALFEPALRCGKPTRATFTIRIRFAAS